MYYFFICFIIFSVSNAAAAARIAIEIPVEIRTSFVRALKVAQEKQFPRPKQYRHIFELQKILGGWRTTAPKNLASLLYSENAHQKTIYEFLHAQILKGIHRPNSIKVGEIPFSECSPDTQSMEIDTENDAFLDGHMIDFDYIPTFPLVLINLRAASNLK